MAEVKQPLVEVMCTGDVLWTVRVDGEQVYQYLREPAPKGRTYNDLIRIALGAAFMAGKAVERQDENMQENVQKARAEAEACRKVLLAVREECRNECRGHNFDEALDKALRGGI